MKKTKLDKQLEKILFEVYDKGVKHEDCNLTASIESVKQALRIHDVVGRSEQLPQPDCHFYDEEHKKWIWAYSKELIDSSR